MASDRNDPFRAGSAPIAAKRMNSGRDKTAKHPADPSYGQGPRVEGMRFPPGAQPQLTGQAKEDNRRQEHRVAEASHSSGEGIPAHQYEPTPSAGRVP